MFYVRALVIIKTGAGVIVKTVLATGLFMIGSVTYSQPQPDIIDSLARGWTGGRSTSLCKPDGVNENGVGISKCEWLLPQGQPPVQGEVHTTRYQADTAMIDWQRQMAGITDMNRVVDSLGFEFKRRGMTMRPCRPGMTPAGSVDSRIWEDKKLLVHISAITPPVGPPKILVVGVNVPSSYPEVICPKRREGFEQ